MIDKRQTLKVSENGRDETAQCAYRSPGLEKVKGVGKRGMEMCPHLKGWAPKLPSETHPGD